MQLSHKDADGNHHYVSEVGLTAQGKKYVLHQDLRISADVLSSDVQLKHPDGKIDKIYGKTTISKEKKEIGIELKVINLLLIINWRSLHFHVNAFYFIISV